MYWYFWRGIGDDVVESGRNTVADTAGGSMRRRDTRSPNSRWHDLTAVVRRLRQAGTAAEREAWELLRDRRMFGLKFRRQHVIRGFIVDFYCHELKLAVEIDGDAHANPDQIDRDVERNAILRNLGHEVIRIPNSQVPIALPQKVLRQLQRTHAPSQTSPSPIAEAGPGDEDQP